MGMTDFLLEELRTKSVTNIPQIFTPVMAVKRAL